MKLPKFMICKSPMVKGSGAFILHTREPRMLLKVLDLTGMNDMEVLEIRKQIPVGGSTEIGDEYFIVSPVLYFDEVEIEGQTDVDALAKLMRRAADWWHAYIKFKSKNNDLA